jgi:Fe-S-cluster containining protein
VADAYAALVAKVDAFVVRVSARHAGDLRCAAGCASCCHARLSITTVEADAITAWAAAQAAARRAAIAAAAAAEPTDRCAALDADDRCRIYDARPLVCRSHGIPIRLHERGLPVVTACALNFTARGPAAADPDCVLDQTLVSTTLGLIDRAAGGDPDRRVDLAGLLADLPA